VIVAGGGPGGYASAIALARAGFSNITVVERSPHAAYYEPTKAFCMALFPHGKQVLRDIGLHDIDHAGAAR
jgi:kynurenine 3-monooxygenase